MAFPTLFPDGKGDPTNLALERTIASNELENFSLKIRHLLKFCDVNDDNYFYRFAAHPRFAYWAFNILYRRRILSRGNLYIKRNPGEMNFTLDEFNEMLNSNCANELMKKVFYYTKDVSGSRSFWNKVRNNLTATVKQVGVFTIFFTFSMAEFHWPDLLSKFKVDVNDVNGIRKFITENPHVVDYYFTERTNKFVKHWLYNLLKATWHWYRFEYASRGSIHCHGVAKLEDDPGLVELTNIALKGYLASQKLKSENVAFQEKELNEIIAEGSQAEKQVCDYVDKLLCTCNPMEGENWVKPQVHPCKVDYRNLNPEEMSTDYANLVNSVEKHLCSSAYCLRQKNDDTTCRFHFPFEVNEKTHLEFEKVKSRDGVERFRAKVVTSRNDPRVNRHQRVLLQGWRANVDISVVVDYHSCVEYLTKYASKPEKLSDITQDAFTHVASKVNSDNFSPSSAIKKLMMRSVGLRDMSVQEVCHQILGLKYYSSSYEVYCMSLDGSRQVELVDGEVSTKKSHLDIYAFREDYSSDPRISEMNFIQFHANYVLVNEELHKRKKEVVIRTFPSYSSSPNSIHYSKYCKYSLLKYKVWRHTPNSAWGEIDATDEGFIMCWATFLRSDAAVSVPNHLRELETIENAMMSRETGTDSQDSDSEDDSEVINDEISNYREEWMFLADHFSNPQQEDNSSGSENRTYWLDQCSQYNSISRLEMPAWINSKKATLRIEGQLNDEDTELQNVLKLNDQQRKAFEMVRCHINSNSQLLMIIFGKAGCGKSFLIHRLRHLLGDALIISSLFGLAAYSVGGKTLHHLLRLPIKGKFNSELEGSSLIQLQERLKGIRYIIIDEYSVINRTDLAWVNRRCKQATGKFDVPFGGINMILSGDLGQLPPVKGHPIYYNNPRNELEAEGFFVYQLFNTVIELTVNQRSDGSSSLQKRFRSLLSNVRDGNVSIDDWKLLLTRSGPSIKTNFSNALKLSYGNKDVAENNFKALEKLNQPIARISALHNDKKAAKCSLDDMGGLAPTLLLSVGARVMLMRNLWTESGLCNGAMGTVCSIVFKDNETPPSFPIAVIVQFDQYSGPSFSELQQNLVPIPPIANTSDSLGSNYERIQFPLRLAWSITIHKSQGLTLEQMSIDLGKSERASGQSYVALSRAKTLDSIYIEPMPYERLKSLAKSKSLKKRLDEESRLRQLGMTK
ncbi:uncharacterized protein [Clytia hemisphaerica]|uniref:uncharacterized protein n=2 Tax=Clytia hemisphaerica TaxID=252671 RepID=UPI0034D4680E